MRLMAAWRLDAGVLGSWTQVSNGSPIGQATLEGVSVLFLNGDRLDGLHPGTREFSVSNYEVMKGFLADREHLPLTVELSESIRRVAASVAVILSAQAESDSILKDAVSTALIAPRTGC